jgi:tRNA-dihydrouridine synthase A
MNFSLQLLSIGYICSVAPMMEWTDKHYRTVARIISKHAWLYTEMLAAETIVYQQGNLVCE